MGIITMLAELRRMKNLQVSGISSETAAAMQADIEALDAAILEEADAEFREWVEERDFYSNLRGGL